MAREFFSVLPYPEGGGATIARSTERTNMPETHKIGERQYQTVCDFLRDVLRGMDRGRIELQPPAYRIFLSPAGGTIFHETGNATQDHILGTWAINAFVALCELVAMGKDGADFKSIAGILDDLKHGNIENNAQDTDRAWSAGVAAAIVEIGHWEGSDITGREIHQAWYQGMIMQGREVPPPRRQWETLDQRDRDLDIHIARVFLQQLAINVDTEVRAQRAMGDDPVPTRMAEYLYRQMETEGKSAESLALNLTNNELAQLVIDARNDRDAAEIRHAKSEELRRNDHAAWTRLIDQRNITVQTLNELQGDHEAMAITVQQQAREIAQLNELRETLDREIVKLHSRLQSARDVANAEAAKIDSQRFTPQQAAFFATVVRSLTVPQSPTGIFAALTAETAAIRQLINARDITDPIGFARRCATVAACALALSDALGGDLAVADGARMP
jgi:hypothetical protein